MVTFNVTIDEVSNQDLFLRIMKELKFVVSVKVENKSAFPELNELVSAGNKVEDHTLESIFASGRDSGNFTLEQSKTINNQRFNEWRKIKEK